MHHGRFARVTLLALCLLQAPGCIQDDGKRWTPLAELDLVSLDEERELGMEFDRELRQQFRLITDPVVTGFLHDLGQRIVRGVEPQPYIYRFGVVQAPSLNAFAVPGGYIYFHTGTLLQAGSVDELAGVMGHEIAHVKARHYAHRKRAQQIPGMVTQLALIAASIAAQEPGIMIAGQAVNVSMQLRFSRTDEAEADQKGAVFAARAGFDPAASAYFFDRILAEQDLYLSQVPPYLFSHPGAESRSEEVRERARTLSASEDRDPTFERRFYDMQARLAAILASGRQELPGPGSLEDHSGNDAELDRIDLMVDAGESENALAALLELSLEDRLDPRIPFRIGEVLFDQGRIDGAIAAFRRTLELDSTYALVYYRLGMAYKANGDRQRAVYALEQCLQRASPTTSLSRRAHWEVEKLTFGIIAEAGFADGSKSRGADTPAGDPVDTYRARDPRMAWWARVSPPMIKHIDELRIQWRDPSGEIALQHQLEGTGRVFTRSYYEFSDKAPPTPGIWRVDLLLDGEVVHKDDVRLLP